MILRSKFAKTLWEWWGAASRWEQLAAGSLIAATFLQLFATIWLVPAGHDAILHLRWIEDWSASWRAGDVYPRWLPDANSGFGSPVFYFYPPLAYIIPALAGVLLPWATADVLLRIVFGLTAVA